MDFGDAFVQALEVAVTPTAADVSIARGVILSALESPEPQLLTTFEDAWLEAQGTRRPAERSQYFAAASAAPWRRFEDPEPADPHLMQFRGRHAVRRAVAQLTAVGVLARGEGNQYDLQPERLSITYAGGGDSAPLFVHSPFIADASSTPRFLLVTPEDAGAAEALLPVDEMLADLKGILGAQGEQLVRESRKSLQRGLYLSSSSLLAAASEAAWFNLARSIPESGEKLHRLTTEGRDIAEVIRLTEPHLLTLKRSRTLVTEIHQPRPPLSRHPQLRAPPSRGTRRRPRGMAQRNRCHPVDYRGPALLHQDGSREALPHHHCLIRAGAPAQRRSHAYGAQLLGCTISMAPWKGCRSRG
ncbi:hypothetical protein FB561_3212 [Kribbella amoyensis]|uniref:Uncharacterized protein n=1 Tax=Kribbella amoyensis TaxID=996641 RepID=A0A561BT94_9ACTN|nr:hypothetical protein FB561_3212 [Kribbella amoyensis]